MQLRISTVSEKGDQQCFVLKFDVIFGKQHCESIGFGYRHIRCIH